MIINVQALDLLNQFDDFKIPAAFFAIALNEMDILRTRYDFLSYVCSNKNALKDQFKAEKISK